MRRTIFAALRDVLIGAALFGVGWFAAWLCWRSTSPDVDAHIAVMQSALQRLADDKAERTTQIKQVGAELEQCEMRLRACREGVEVPPGS